MSETTPCAGCGLPVRVNQVFVAYPIVDARYLFDRPSYFHPACHDPRERKRRRETGVLYAERPNGTPRPCIATGRRPRTRSR